jgi:hypothetical protein
MVAFQYASELGQGLPVAAAEVVQFSDADQACTTPSKASVTNGTAGKSPTRRE